MVFDDDYLQLVFENGDYKRIFCAKINCDWPPPERIEIAGFIWKRARHSAITDEQRAGMTRICRGAEYFADEDQSGSSAYPSDSQGSSILRS